MNGVDQAATCPANQANLLSASVDQWDSLAETHNAACESRTWIIFLTGHRGHLLSQPTGAVLHLAA